LKVFVFSKYFHTYDLNIKRFLYLTLQLPGLDINVCPIPVKTDVRQVDLVLRLSDGQIYFHWYKILGLLYKTALFDLQFLHNLFWLKLKWNARSKLFYCIIYRSSRHALMKFKDIDKIKSRNLRNALMNWNINIWNIKTRIIPERTCKNDRISIWHQI
jgi:hypothetical protein